MAALSGASISELLNKESPGERLVISPLLEPSEQLRKAQCSVDLRLGFQYEIVATSQHGAIDELSPNERDVAGDGQQTLDFRSLYVSRYVPFGAGIVVHPHTFVLATTLEYIRLPGNVMAYVVSRSSWGRLGLITATAIGVQPGFAGCLTLELRNLGETPLWLYPGQTVAQVFFHYVEPKVDVEDAAGQTEAIPKGLSKPTSLKKLRLLKQKHDKSPAPVNTQPPSSK